MATDTSVADAPVASPPAGSKNKLVLIGGGVLAFVLLEVAILYMFMPKAAEPVAKTEQAEKTEEETDETQDETAEVAIGGNFSCTNSKAAAGTVVHVDFKLHALVGSDSSVKFAAKLTDHAARIRQAILKVVRSASLEELNDPNLSTMKRLIREEINKVLRKSFVLEIVISDYRTMEQ